MRSIYTKILISIISLGASLPVVADNLLSVYQLATQADPEFQSAIAAHAAALEVVPQSRAGLLPDISLSADVSRNRYHDRDPDPDESTNKNKTNQVYGVSLRQSIYHRERFKLLEQANSRAAQADAEFVAAQQDLILRTANRYFVVLGAQDNLNFVKSDKDAIEITLKQAKQRLKAGVAATTDVHDAQARYDFSVSNEINAVMLLEDAQEALRELTGEQPQALEALKQGTPLLAPAPANMEEWVTIATEQNPLLLAAKASTKVARQEMEVQRSGHYPTLDLTAGYAYKDISFGGSIPQKRNDSAVGIELDIPLYQGGLVSSKTRQARDTLTQAQEQQTKQHREIERQVRDNYRGVLAEISKVNALGRAVLSNEQAVEASEKGFKLGIRTIVDTLDNQRELLRARRDHARSRYDYLLNTLKLKQAAGIVSETDIAQINEMLD